MATGYRPRKPAWMDRAVIWLLAALIALVLTVVLAWQLPYGSQVRLRAGEVAPEDVISPRQITYESQVLTDRSRERAAQSVPEQYDPPDDRIRRQQVERVRNILEYITIVREDQFASPEQQTDYLLAINDLTLTPELALHILSVTPEQWTAIATEVPLALDRAMREEIRESTVSIIRRRVPALISPTLDDRSSDLAAEIIRGMVVPNSILNQARTDELRQKARDDVPVQRVTLARNETILRSGDIATQEDVEALAQIGLLQEDWDWWALARAVFYMFGIMVVCGGMLYRLRDRTLRDVREFALVTVAVIAWLIAAKLMVIPHDWLPLLFPLAALGMLVAVLVDLRVAVVITIAFAMVIYYIGRSTSSLVPYLTLGTLLGAVILGRAERLIAFLWAGMGVAACNLLIVSAFRAPLHDLTMIKLLQLHLVVFLNGGLSASIAIIGYLFLGNLFGITTSLQLTELSRPTHPLLRQLLLKASGTYHHTIVVSNLAERAAAAIGADAFLARVGTYYHDIGKTVRPYFFTENIADGSSPHEKLDPLTSAQIIISHVSDGLDLARKYRLPPRIQDFISEHHGRSLVKYFYIQAQRAAGEGEVVNEADFRYPGPSPRSKETAILLLADTCEAAVRASRPGTREDLETLINRLIDERVAEGELNDCNLTFRELQIIKDIFLHVLQGVHHPRIQYPEPVTKTAAAPAPRPVTDQPAAEPQITGNGAGAPVPGGVEEPASA